MIVLHLGKDQRSGIAMLEIEDKQETFCCFTLIACAILVVIDVQKELLYWTTKKIILDSLLVCKKQYVV